MSFIYKGQSKLQGNLSPGKFAGASWNHSEKEKWTITGDFEFTWNGVIQAVKEQPRFQVFKANKSKKTMKISVFTPTAKWLDMVDLKFEKSKADDNDVTIVHAFSCSSGLFPLSIPFAPVLNYCLFFVPFGDGGKNYEWLKAIRTNEIFKDKVTVERLKISFSNDDKAK